MNNPNKKVKVLVISGGGVYGIIPCHFLNLILSNTIDKIDVFGGTSVGGILSLHLSTYLDTQKLYNDFKSNVNNFFIRELNNVINPFSAKYSEKPL
jgi:patatin-like phospholipase/acyl hydrolase